VKRSGRDEPIWVIIHMCMVTTLGISLYSYLYLKLAKRLFFLLSLMFALQQSWTTRGWNRFHVEAGVEGGRGRREGAVAQEVYTHVSKSRND
jgi:hypothetical protein